jgi:hypothetical protein
MCEGGTGLGWSLRSADGYEVWEVGSWDSYKIYGTPFLDGVNPALCGCRRTT